MMTTTDRQNISSTKTERCVVVGNERVCLTCELLLLSQNPAQWQSVLVYLETLTSDAEHSALRLQARVPRLAHVVLCAAEAAFDYRVLASGTICRHETVFLQYKHTKL